MCYFEEFLKELYKLLTLRDNISNNIVKKHTRNLNKQGDVGFPLYIGDWKCLLGDDAEECKTIFEFASKQRKFEINEKKLVELSEAWPLSIDKCIINNSHCCIFLNRVKTFEMGIRTVLHEKMSYGSFPLDLRMEAVLDEPDKELLTTDVRLLIIKEAINRFLEFNAALDCNASKLQLTTKSAMQSESQILVCGPVLTRKRQLNSATRSELEKARCEAMRLMAEHKYGIRVKNSTEWMNYCAKLADAAIIIDMLQNKITSATIIDLENHNTKDAAFIMYNHTRLTTLLNDFAKKADQNVYRQLPAHDCIDFHLLKQPEEWELLLVYILQFPMLVKRTIIDVSMGKVNLHLFVAFLRALAASFSVYYRRVKILTAGQEHLLPTLYARIYLLQALNCIFTISFHLLGIEPIKKM